MFHYLQKFQFSTVKVSLATLLAMTMAGLEFGRIGRDSYFIDVIGAQYIPYMYIADGCLLIFSAFCLTKMAKITTPVKLALVLYVAAIPLVLLLWVAMLTSRNIPFLPYLVFSLVDVVFLLLILGFWGVASYCCTAEEGKKNFPFVGSFGLLGTCLGAFLANQLISWLGVEVLFLIWACLLIACWRFLTGMDARLLKNRFRQEEHLTTSKQGNNIELCSDTNTPSTWSIPLIRTLTYMAIPLWIIVFVIEFYYLSTMARVFEDQKSLAHFLSSVVFISTLCGFIIQVFITPRLLHYFGVGTTNLFYHFSLTTGAISLLIFSLIPNDGNQLELYGIALFVVFARFCDIAVFYSIYDSSSQLLFYSLPSKLLQKGQIFIVGMVVPLSTVLAGSLLVLFDYVQMPIYSVAFMAVMMGFMLLIISLNISPEYLSSLIANISPRDNYRQREIKVELQRLERSDARYVLLQSLCSVRKEEAAFAMTTLEELIGDSGFVELVADIREILPELHQSVLPSLMNKFGVSQTELLLKHDIQLLIEQRERVLCQ